jgi:hypothetical protein
MDLETKKIKDESEKKLIENVRQFGWSIMNVFDEKGNEPDFSYTIGIHHTTGQPELIITGIPGEPAKGILNEIGQYMKNHKIEPFKKYTDFLANDIPAIFLPVDVTVHRKLVGFNIWFYEGKDFPLFQVVWPDKEGHFPWEQECAEGIKASQFLLTDQRPT